MIVGEGPGRDEDMEGRPFVGRAGQLLDRMFAAIGLSRTSDDAGTSIYITNVVPWRPPQNRDPSPIEIDMMLPFLRRHMHWPSLKSLSRWGTFPVRHYWENAVLPNFADNGQQDVVLTLCPCSTAYLLRNPLAKREAWQDLQAVQKRIR